MKKFVSVVLFFVLAVSLGASCFADSIAIYPDKFYEEHIDEFEKPSNWYYVCASGSVAQKNPVNPIRSFTLTDNFTYYARCAYTDGKGVVWIYIAQNNSTADDAKLGWIPVDSLRPVYGDEDFYADHSDEYIFPESGEEILTADLSDGVVAYTYPASGEKNVVNAGVFAEPVSFSYRWVDENGATWAMLYPKDVKSGNTEEYLSGSYGFWFCIDNPLAGYELAPNAESAEVVFDPEAPEIEGIAAFGDYVYLDDSTPVPYVPAFGKYLLYAVGITLAAAVCAVVLAFVLKKKKQN